MTSPQDRLSTALAGRYRIERELGAGGMATVYLAHDERHDRKVALKVLHEDLGATLGPDRFLAEIKTTARLQHPHILPLLDSGNADGLLFYVMPFVEGETLRERLVRETQLPMDDAVRLSREIADALAFAHAQGVVHRDIKPENILLQGGHALVADFGIALAVRSAGGARLTQTGLSLGTPQYMAPEQAMGEKSVDARADIYALGAVTYEMLTGEPPFTGANVQAIVAKVLSVEPEPPTTIRKTIPAHVEAAVLAALAKLPADRPATATVFAAALAGGTTGIRTGVGAGATRARAAAPGVASNGRLLATIAAGTALGIAIGYAAWGRSMRASDEPVTRTYLHQPAAELPAGGPTDFVLSPDGEQIVYVGPAESGGSQLWRKRRAELHATPIVGTTGGSYPFFSPDGRWLAFAAHGNLMKIPTAGGAAVTIAGGVPPRDTRGAWFDDGHIVTGFNNTTGRVPADGGVVDTIIRSLDLAGFFPTSIVALPGSKGSVIQACAGACARSDVWVYEFAARKARLLISSARAPAYIAPGYLMYVTSDGTAMAAPFDALSLTLRGAAKPVLEKVAGPLSLSSSGTLLYREGTPGNVVRPVWVDRLGRATVVDSDWSGTISSVALAPGGKRLAVSAVTGTTQDIWIKELDRGPLTRLTFDAAQHFRPAWSADGRRIYYATGDSLFGLAVRNADGSGEARRVPTGGRQVVETVEAHDGSWLVLRTGGQDDPRDVLVMRNGVDTVARLAPMAKGAKFGIDVSPDGKFLAYMSDGSGQPEVWVSPLADLASARWQVSSDGGQEPRWASSGHELFYISAAGDLMVARYAAAPTFAVTSRDKLFDASGYLRDGGFHLFEVAPGDQRFIMLRPEAKPGELVMVDHWTTELREKMRTAR